MKKTQTQRCSLFLSAWLIAACSASNASNELDAGPPDTGSNSGPADSASAEGPAEDGAHDAGQDGPVPVVDPVGFREAGHLSEPRALATATRLDDGRVLVVGGEDSAYGMLASVEIYDPDTDTFSDAAPLPEPRVHHTATLLPSGEVLVVGGGQGSEISLPTGEATLASAVLYDPLADRWRSAGTMSAPRAGHRAVRLADGTVLVAGGGSVVGYPCAASHPSCTVAASIATVELYDPVTGEWSALPPMTQPRLAFALDSLPAGVVASGGAANNNGLTSVEVFDPATKRWSSGPPLIGPRLYHATVVCSNRLIVAGGKLANIAPITTVDVLEDGASAWTAGAPLSQPRTGARFAPLPSGAALLIGGNNQLGEPFIAEAAIYDLTTNAWEIIAPLAVGRYSHAVAVLEDGSVVVIGGRGPGGALDRVERTR